MLHCNYEAHKKRSTDNAAIYWINAQPSTWRAVLRAHNVENTALLSNRVRTLTLEGKKALRVLHCTNMRIRRVVALREAKKTVEDSCLFFGLLLSFCIKAVLLELHRWPNDVISVCWHVPQGTQKLVLQTFQASGKATCKQELTGLYHAVVLYLSSSVIPKLSERL